MSAASFAPLYQSIGCERLPVGSLTQHYCLPHLIVRELNPEDTNHDPNLLEEGAEKIMGRWGRA